jgi:superfamily II DNA or RNA helicase
MMDTVLLRTYDEVHDKVICDAGIAMEIADYFTFDVPGAKFTPAYRSKVWDGKLRIFNPMVSLLYCGLRQHLEQFCKSRDYAIEYEGAFADTEFSLHEANDFIAKLAPKHTPRDYQLDAFVHAVRKRRSLLLSPTGSGKSLIIYLLSCYYRSKTLVIVPTTSLVHQMASDFEDYGLPKSMVHKIMSGQEKASNAPFVISTWQSIYKMPKSWFQQFKVVIGDEAHLFKAKSLISILSKMTDCKYKFGFTGTLDGTQTNKLVLEGLFGPVRKVTTTAELMEQKHLAELSIKCLLLKYPDDVKKIASKYDYQAEMDFLVRNDKRNQFIKNLALSLNGNTLLLFQYVEKHGKVLYDLITKEAIDRSVYFISGAIDGEKRDEIRRIIETETNAVVVASYGTSSTGINIRNLSNVVFASPSKSRVRNLQSIGRGLRTSETKSSATLYDIADDLSWKSTRNHTLNHFVERVKIYNTEQFKYKVYNIELYT